MKKKNGKRLAVWLLLAAMVLAVCGCGEKEPDYVSTLSEELQPYATPWIRDVVAETVEKGTLDFYFMSGEGLMMNDNGAGKWGDACLIVFPDGKTMLVDSGQKEYTLVLVENLKRLGIERLDYIVLSHPHSDHSAGFVSAGGVLETFEVGEALYTGVYNAAWSNIHNFEDKCTSCGVPYKVITAGDTFEISGVSFEVFWPEQDWVGQTCPETECTNNHSLLFRMDYGEFSALFTGDLYKAGERNMVAQYGEKLDVDLLKLPHHGNSGTSCSKELFAGTTPELSVATGNYIMTPDVYGFYISCGAPYLFDNGYGYIHVTADKDGQMTWETTREPETDVYDVYDQKFLKN